MASSALPCSRADVAWRARLSKSDDWPPRALIWPSSAWGNTIATTSRNSAKSSRRRLDDDLLLTVKAVADTQADVSMPAFSNEFTLRHREHRVDSYFSYVLWRTQPLRAD